MKKLFLVQYGNVRALVTGRSLFRLPLSGTTFLLTSNTAVLSHSSKLLSNLSLDFCLLLAALTLLQALDAIQDLFVCFCIATDLLSSLAD